MLLSFDFDGTLLHPPEILELPAEFFAALEKLMARGAKWVVNTGRSMEHALEGLHEAGLEGRFQPDYLLLREQEIWQPDGQGGWEDFQGWNAQLAQRWELWWREHEPILEEIRLAWETSDRGVWMEDSYDPAGITAWNEQLLEDFLPVLREYRSRYPRLSWQRNRIWLRFVIAGYDKGALLSEVARQLGIKTERVFAIGDGHNDLEMLDPEVAGYFGCPSNAWAEVKGRVEQRGGWLLERPASYGVAQALERLDSEWG